MLIDSLLLQKHHLKGCEYDRTNHNHKHRVHVRQRIYSTINLIQSVTQTFQVDSIELLFFFLELHHYTYITDLQGYISYEVISCL